jgi:hypothetical protein
MQPQEWFELLRAQLPATAPAPSDAEVDALLDLARVAAHTSERWAAPVSTFVAGVALAAEDPADRVERIRELTARLEAAAPPSGEGAAE